MNKALTSLKCYFSLNKLGIDKVYMLLFINKNLHLISHLVMLILVYQKRRVDSCQYLNTHYIHVLSHSESRVQGLDMRNLSLHSRRYLS